MDTLFEAAVKLPPERRDEFVAESCADDTELCDYIVSLLQIDSGAADDLEKTVVDALQSAISGAIGQREEMAGGNARSIPCCTNAGQRRHGSCLPG